MELLGNVVVGDAGAPVETWIHGTVACGYQAVKTIEKELNGQKGYLEYIDWWQKAFAFNDPRYWKVAGVFSLNQICTVMMRWTSSIAFSRARRGAP